MQFSCHLEGPGGLKHHAWLAARGSDPREGIARALLAACEGAASIVAYNVSFERRCIEGLTQAVPALAAQLSALGDKLVDLLPVVRDHVYHPAFNGSFSITRVLPALVPELAYDDLEISDGGTASTQLQGLLLGDDGDDAARVELREQLLAYCERDTLGMVRLFGALENLVKGGAGQRLRAGQGLGGFSRD